MKKKPQYNFLKALGFFAYAMVFVLTAVWLTSRIDQHPIPSAWQKKATLHTETQDQEIISLKGQVIQLQKDQESLLNWFCLDIQQYSDDTQTVEDESNPDPLQEPGRCAKGFRE